MTSSMFEVLKAVADALNQDEFLGAANCSTTISSGDPVACGLNRLRPMSLELLPRGSSQTASAGNLSEVAYFSLALRWRPAVLDEIGKPLDLPYSVMDRVVASLHRGTFADGRVLFNKSMVAESDLTVTVSERRYYVPVPKGEMVALLFFWVSRLPLSVLESSGGSSDDDAPSGVMNGTLLGVGSSGDSSGEEPDDGGLDESRQAMRHLEFGRLLF